MRKYLTILCLSAIPMLAACGTIGNPHVGDLGSGEYAVARYPGHLPHVENSAPAEWTGVQFEQLQYLDANCRVQMRAQVPTAGKSIGTTIGRNVLGMGIGTGVGAVAAFGGQVSAAGYAAYGAIAGTGNMIGSAIDRHSSANRNSVAGCMAAMVPMARSRDGALGGIAIVYNTDTVNGRPLHRPTAGEEVHGNSTPRPGEDDHVDAPAPH